MRLCICWSSAANGTCCRGNIRLGKVCLPTLGNGVTMAQGLDCMTRFALNCVRRSVGINIRRLGLWIAKASKRARGLLNVATTRAKVRPVSPKSAYPAEGWRALTSSDLLMEYLLEDRREFVADLTLQL